MAQEMKFTPMESIPANANPFRHDAYHMGTALGSNVLAMYEQHIEQHQPYVILVDKTTGQRIRVDFAEKK